MILPAIGSRLNLYLLSSLADRCRKYSIKFIAGLILILSSSMVANEVVYAQPESQPIEDREAVPKFPPLLWTGTFMFSEGRGRVRLLTQGFERYGYVDENGKMVIPPKYLAIGNFAQGLAPVKFSNQKYGFIDHAGKTIIPPRYDLAYGFSDGLAIVEIDGKMGALDRRGKLVIKPVYRSTAWEFQEGLLAVKQGNRWGFVDRRGKMAISPQFVDAKPNLISEEELDIANYYTLKFSDGLAAVTLDGVNYGYINKQGKIAIPLQFKYARAFSEGLGLVQTRSGNWGFVDKAGKLAIELPPANNLKLAEATLLSIFSEGLAGVKIGDKWGFIDRTGKQVIPPKFDNVYPFSEGLAGVMIDGKYGFIDRTGKQIISPNFDRVFSFKSGFAPVVIGEYGTINARVGYIDRQGKLVIQQPK